MAADTATARDRLVAVVRGLYAESWDGGIEATPERVVDSLFTDENFDDIIRVLGGKVAGLDKRMRVEWGSSVLFKQGGDLYE